jgi:hypothetical protein
MAVLKRLMTKKFPIRIITTIRHFVKMVLNFRITERRIKMSQIQERMKKLGVKQVDMILELRKRGIVVQPPEMSSILRGVYTYPKAKVVLDECDKILSEHEAK